MHLCCHVSIYREVNNVQEITEGYLTTDGASLSLITGTLSVDFSPDAYSRWSKSDTASHKELLEC